MKKKQQVFLIPLLAMLLLITCKKPYEPPEIRVDTNFLVVDGIISCGNNVITTITLSRTARLSDSVLFHPENNATVFIEQEQGNSFLLAEQGSGIYKTGPLDLDPGNKYRLRIITGNNREYVSAYTGGKTAPPIDSLTWEQDKNVTVFVHTHDPQNNTRYYRWEYEETWNYKSIYSTDYGVKDGLIFVKDASTQTDSCWRTTNSNNIILSSSVALSQDVISKYPVALVPQHTEKISKRYSILVKQYGITQEAFQYLQLIQRNTQQLGTLFDAQPSQLIGNIRSVDNSNEPVIGYISASTSTEKRIFIKNSQVTDWHYAQNLQYCGDILFILQNATNYQIWSYPDPSFGPYYFVSGGGLAIAKKGCLECTEQGGTNTKPVFW